jgi:hypothetical protein
MADEVVHEALYVLNDADGSVDAAETRNPWVSKSSSPEIDHSDSEQRLISSEVSLIKFPFTGIMTSPTSTDLRA